MRTSAVYRKCVLESPHVIWRSTDMFTKLFLGKHIFWHRNDPKRALGASDAVRNKQKGCYHSKEHQQIFKCVFRMIDLVKICWCVQTWFKGVSGPNLGGPPVWQFGALWSPRGECFAPCLREHSWKNLFFNLEMTQNELSAQVTRSESSNGVVTIRKIIKNHANQYSGWLVWWCFDVWNLWSKGSPETLLEDPLFGSLAPYGVPEESASHHINVQLAVNRQPDCRQGNS